MKCVSVQGVADRENAREQRGDTRRDPTDEPRSFAARAHRGNHISDKKTCVRTASAIKTPIETTTTAVVVARPTPSVPPRVIMPK